MYITVLYDIVFMIISKKNYFRCFVLNIVFHSRGRGVACLIMCDRWEHDRLTLVRFKAQ